MEITTDELDTVIEKTLGIYRTILKQHTQHRDGSILLRDDIFKNLDEIVDFMFVIRRREHNTYKEISDGTLHNALELFDKQTKSKITKMDTVIQNYYKKAL